MSHSRVAIAKSLNVQKITVFVSRVDAIVLKCAPVVIARMTRTLKNSPNFRVEKILKSLPPKNKELPKSRIHEQVSKLST